MTAIYKNLIFFILSSILVSCGGTVENSNSLDNVLYGESPDGSANFIAAREIILQNCGSCHGTWLGFSEKDFISAGLVVSGNYTNSKIYYRNKNAQAGVGSQDMPLGSSQSPLSQAQLQVIKDWISAL